MGMGQQSGAQAQGFAIIPRWLLQSTSVTAHAKMVYAVLTGFADQNGVCWPSHATIAEQAGVAVSTAKKALAELRDLGVLTWQMRERKDGGRSSNMYRITSHVAVPEETPAADSTPGTPAATPPTPRTYPLAATHRGTRTTERVPSKRGARGPRRTSTAPRSPALFGETSDHLDGW